MIMRQIFMLNKNLTSILKHFFGVPFKNLFFCNFWGKNALFGYLENTVVAWLCFLGECNKN